MIHFRENSNCNNYIKLDVNAILSTMEYNDRIDVQLDDNHSIEDIDLLVRNLGIIDKNGW